MSAHIQVHGTPDYGIPPYMHVLTTLLAVSVTRLLPLALRRAGWRSKAELRRRALVHLKNGELEEAIHCALRSRRKLLRDEKALVLHEILLMHLDAEQSRVARSQERLRRARDRIQVYLLSINSAILTRTSRHRHISLSIIAVMIYSYIYSHIIKVILENNALIDFCVGVIIFSFFSAVTLQKQKITLQSDRKSIRALGEKQFKLKLLLAKIETRRVELERHLHHISYLKESVSGGM